MGHSGAILGHFGASLEPLWGHIGMTLVHFGVTLVRPRVHNMYLGVNLAQFQKILIFPIDFNDFMHLWDYIGVILDAPKSNLESLWGSIS